MQVLERCISSPVGYQEEYRSPGRGQPIQKAQRHPRRDSKEAEQKIVLKRSDYYFSFMSDKGRKSIGNGSIYC